MFQPQNHLYISVWTVHCVQHILSASPALTFSSTTQHWKYGTFQQDKEIIGQNQYQNNGFQRVSLKLDLLSYYTIIVLKVEWPKHGQNTWRKCQPWLGNGALLCYNSRKWQWMSLCTIKKSLSVLLWPSKPNGLSTVKKVCFQEGNSLPVWSPVATEYRDQTLY